MRIRRLVWLVGTAALVIGVAVAVYLVGTAGPPPASGGSSSSPTPAPVVSVPTTHGETSKNTDVDKLAACVRAANQDPVKLQECAKRK